MGRASMPQGTAIHAHGWTALACALAAMAGCGSDDPHVRYRMLALQRATAEGCSPPDGSAPMFAGATRARLTFRDEGATGPGALRCDVVLPLGEVAPMIAVPRRGARVAMWVEYFDDAGTLLGRGAQRDVAIDSGDTVRLEIGATGDFSCASLQAAQPRAFHSATLLPDGKVLLLGGLAGSLAQPGTSFLPDDGAYALATGELYDPVDGTTRAVSVPGLLPRAFHQTVIVGEDAAGVHLLVVGGSGVNPDATAPGNVAAIPGGSGAPPWILPGVDLGRGRLGARPLPLELLTYRTGSRTLSRMEIGAGAPELRTESAAGLVAAAGGTVTLVGGRTSNGAASAVVESVKADGTVGGTTSGRMRVGATVTVLPAGDAIVYGGDVGSDTGSVRAFDHLSGLDASPAIDTGPSGNTGTNRAYHATARLGADHVVAIGGLHLSAGALEDRGPDDVIGRVATSGLGFSTIDPGGAPATAYLDAVTLHDGSVLAAGGARPAACSRTVVCPSTTSLRVEADGSAARVSGSLGLARYGHRLVKLADGTVLAFGGFTTDPADAEKLRATAVVEQFEAHRAADDPLADLAIMRAPGDIARDEQGLPLAECARVGVMPPMIDGGTDAEIDAP